MKLRIAAGTVAAKWLCFINFEGGFGYDNHDFVIQKPRDGHICYSGWHQTACCRRSVLLIGGRRYAAAAAVEITITNDAFCPVEESILLREATGMKRYNWVAVRVVFGAVVIAADCSIVEGAMNGEGVRVASWGAALFLKG